MNKKVEAKTGINLDIGGGYNPHPGYVNMDMMDIPEVDIVWDIETFPWPLKDESVNRAIASHVLEHINPHKGIFIKVMDELWRVLKPGAQFAFVVPHGESPGYIQDPTHCNPINELTMHYFDPAKQTGLYAFYKPKPWQIDEMYSSNPGTIECVMTKRRDDPSYHRQPFYPIDITKEPQRGLEKT